MSKTFYIGVSYDVKSLKQAKETLTKLIDAESLKQKE